MTALAIMLLLLAASLPVFACLQGLYRERGKIVERELQPGLEIFDTTIEPHLGGARDYAPMGASLWLQFATAAMGGILVGWTLAFTPATPSDWIEAALLLGLAVVGAHVLADWLIRRARLHWLSRLAPALRLCLYLMLPLSVLVSLGGRLAGLGGNPAPVNAEAQRESEIEALVEAGEEEGIIEADERELVQSALEFGDKRLREVMVPRPDLVALPTTATFLELRELAQTRHYQRVPVYQNDLDHVVGVVGMRELLQVPEAEWAKQTVGHHLAPVLFIPESATTFDLLRQMQQRRIHVAIVINEYGAVAGLVTVSDLLEEIVGELPAEGDGPSCARLPDEVPGQYLLLGSLDLDRLEELLGVALPRREANTLGGLLAEHLGRIPRTGERIRIQGLEFEILEANPVRVLKVRVIPGPEAAAARPPRQGQAAPGV